MTAVFLDTSFAVALSSTRDRFHSVALDLAREIMRENVRMITTRAVLIEIENSLSRFRFRFQAIELLSKLESDPKVSIFNIEDSDYHKAFDLYRNRQDKEWGMTDCLSFVIMRENGLIEALTADEHFQQAGFRALLREQN